MYELNVLKFLERHLSVALFSLRVSDHCNIELKLFKLIFASRNSFENAEFGFSARVFGSSYSCTWPLDKTRILYRKK